MFICMYVQMYVRSDPYNHISIPAYHPGVHGQLPFACLVNRGDPRRGLALRGSADLVNWGACEMRKIMGSGRSLQYTCPLCQFKIYRFDAPFSSPNKGAPPRCVSLVDFLGSRHFNFQLILYG